jgi:hypothetical protein
MFLCEYMNEQITELNNKYREILSKVLKNSNVDTYIFGNIYQKAIEEYLVKSKENGFKIVAINYPILSTFKTALKSDFKVKILDIDDVIELSTNEEDKTILNYIKEISIYQNF